jgi:hypothetical protein
MFNKNILKLKLGEINKNKIKDHTIQLLNNQINQTTNSNNKTILNNQIITIQNQSKNKLKKQKQF